MGGVRGARTTTRWLRVDPIDERRQVDRPAAAGLDGGEDLRVDGAILVGVDAAASP
jgi:hypothetical protein